MNRDEQIQRLTTFVESQDITPAEADEIAAGAGLTPLECQNWPVTMTDTHWPLAFAVLWVSWRDQDRVFEQWDRFRCWAGHLWRDPTHEGQLVGYSEAETEVWKALQAGKIHATGMPFQEGDITEIPYIQWRNLEWMPGFSRISVRNFGHADARYRCVDVVRDELLGHYPARDQAQQKVDPPLNATSKDDGGPKLGLVVQALRGMYEDKPASKNRVFLLSKINKTVGFDVSFSTLDRAWKKAWR